MEDTKPAYKILGIPRLLNIKGFDLYYKDPLLKNDLYAYRCRKNECNFFIKIDKDNIDKILKKDNDINFIEINIHQDHDLNDVELYETVDHKNASSEKENLKLSISLIKNNIT